MNGNDYLSNGNGVTNKDTDNSNTSSTASDSSKELASTGTIFKNIYSRVCSYIIKTVLCIIIA